MIEPKIPNISLVPSEVLNFQGVTINSAVLSSLVITGIFLLIAVIIRLNLKIIPSKGQLIFEEVVNKRNKGTMSQKEIAERDSLAKRVKGIKAIKGNDSEKNAKYRYATYVMMRKREGKEGGKSKSNSKRKKSKKKR